MHTVNLFHKKTNILRLIITFSVSYHLTPTALNGKKRRHHTDAKNRNKQKIVIIKHECNTDRNALPTVIHDYEIPSMHHTMDALLSECNVLCPQSPTRQISIVRPTARPPPMASATIARNIHTYTC